VHKCCEGVRLRLSALLAMLLATHSGWGQSVSYESLITQAKSDLSAGRLDQALAGAAQAIALDQSRWEAYTLAAGATIKQHRCDEARDYVQKATARAPDTKKQGLASLLTQCSSGVTSPGEIREQEPARREARTAEEKGKFEEVKKHFAVGDAILEEERKTAADLRKAAADQRDALKGKITNLSNQASGEFRAAQKATAEKDPNQHLLWAKIAESYDLAGRNDEAINAYQQAIAAKPSANYYNNLGNVQARAGKIDDAQASYTKSAELDPANAAQAYRNAGITMYNAGKMKEAVEPLKKATELDPESAQAWYLLGASLVGAMEVTKVGEKLEVVVQPGTVEAYQKAVELDPNGPYGQQAKKGLEALPLIAPGVDIKTKVKKKS